MGAIASEITSLTSVYSVVYSDADQKIIKAPCHWPLCGDLTGDWWIPRTNGQLRTRFLLCCALLWLYIDWFSHIHQAYNTNDCPSASKATLTNMDKYFMWIHYERLHNHNKAKHNKTVCIFLGIWVSIRSGNALLPFLPIDCQIALRNKIQWNFTWNSTIFNEYIENENATSKYSPSFLGLNVLILRTKKQQQNTTKGEQLTQFTGCS